MEGLYIYKNEIDNDLTKLASQIAYKTQDFFNFYNKDKEFCKTYNLEEELEYSKNSDIVCLVIRQETIRYKIWWVPQKTANNRASDTCLLLELGYEKLKNMAKNNQEVLMELIIQSLSKNNIVNENT